MNAEPSSASVNDCHKEAGSLCCFLDNLSPIAANALTRLAVKHREQAILAAGARNDDDDYIHLSQTVESRVGCWHRHTPKSPMFRCPALILQPFSRARD